MTRVILVESNSATARAVAAIVEDALPGSDLVVSSSCREAVELAGAGSVDVVLAAATLPEDECSSLLRATDGRARSVVYGAPAPVDRVSALFRDGCSAYIGEDHAGALAGALQNVLAASYAPAGA